MKDKEVRSFDFEVRANENEEYGKFVEGQAIVFGDKYDNGRWDEYIEATALENTDLRDIRLLVNHDDDMIPLARSRRNNKNSTMQLIKNENGLAIRANLDVENNTQAKALYSATQRGDISGMSFMFVVDGDRWEDLDTDHPTRYITSIGKIFEVSAVTFPAYEATSFEARDAKAVESANATLERVMSEYRAKVEEEAKKQQEIENQKQRIRILAQL